MLRYLHSVAVCAIFALLIGCSGFDSTQLLIHPDSTAASSTFDVALVNAYMYIDSSTVISNKVERDSLHLLIGLPESWNVVGAQFVVIRDLKNQQMLELQNGMLDEQAVAGLILQYAAQATALPPDASLPSAINGKTINAHDQSNDAEVPVDVGDVKVWKGFGAPVNIVLEKGDNPDTIIPLDSAMAFAQGADTAGSGSMLDQINSFKALGVLPDSIGVCIIPIAILLKIQAGPVEGTDTLYYFTKTGKMNQAPNAMITLLMPEMADLETGDMAYVPIKVLDPAGVRSERHSFNSSPIRIVADRMTGKVRIDLGAANDYPASIGIYSLHGNLVRTLTPAGAAGSVVWNGADERGNRVCNGSYLVRIADNDGSVVRNIQLVR